jgi:hypothetical protein
MVAPKVKSNFRNNHLQEYKTAGHVELAASNTASKEKQVAFES